MGVSEKQKKASEYFHQGYNCSQAVVMAFEDELGKDKKELAKISVGLGGGVGRMREVCGTVSGMAIVLGMLCGTDEPMSKNTVYPLVQKACGKFTELNGSIVCRELLEGVKNPKKNTNSPAEKVQTEVGGIAEKRTEEFYKKRPCGELVEIAVGIVEEILR